MSTFRLLLEAFRWSCGFWLLWTVPRCRRRAAGVERGTGGGESLGESLAVVIPARDEEGNLPPLLASVAKREGLGSIMVVDDHSTDGTAAVARAAGALVVEPGPVPDGWTGKAWACAAGAEAAAERGAETLLFLDADCVLEEDATHRLLAELRARRGLVSVQPYHLTRRPYERLSLYFNVVAMMGVGCCTPLRRPPAGAFGPCLVTTVADYGRAGGHAAVRGEVLDDVALAGAYRGTGLPTSCLGGRGTITFRMYPDGLRQLLEGWTKNFGSGAASTRPVTLLLIVVWLTGCISAPALFVTAPVALAAGIYVAYGLQLWWMARRLGRFGIVAIAAFPLPLLFFVVVFLWSLYLTFVTKQVTWKGRRIPLSGR